LLLSPVELSYLKQLCATSNHRKKMKAEPTRLIPRKPIENRVFVCCTLPWV